jgi:hypothetical protein
MDSFLLSSGCHWAESTVKTLLTARDFTYPGWRTAGMGIAGTLCYAQGIVRSWNSYMSEIIMVSMALIATGAVFYFTLRLVKRLYDTDE